MDRIRRSVTLLLFMLPSVLVFCNSFQTHLTHPMPALFKDMIQDPLVWAIIKNESGFRQNCVSGRGAVGLMQIMPETALWYETRGNDPVRDLSVPQENIRVGTWLITEALSYYKGDIRKASAAYNAGMGSVDRWIGEKQANWEQLAYPETRIYINRVERDEKIYKKILQKR